MLCEGRNSDKVALERLERLEYRGYDSFGFINQKAAPKKFLGALSKTNLEGELDPESKITISHTRWATHGAVSIHNTHPHVSQNGTFAVVHNGVIANYKELKRELEAEGYVFKSETDTEVISALLERTHFAQKGDIETTVRNSIGRLAGEFAILVVSPEFPNKMVCVKRKSPLLIGMSRKMCIAASDSTALVGDFLDAVHLQDDEVLTVTNDNNAAIPYSLYPDGSIAHDYSMRFENITVTNTTIDKGEFPDFMSKEMAEIPDVIRRSLDVDVQHPRHQIVGKKLLLTGCGSAYYAACIGQLMKRISDPFGFSLAAAADELESSTNISAFDAILAISQSGETFDTIEPLRHLPEDTLKIAITNVQGSTLARIADKAIIQNAGIERCVLSTKSIVSQCALLYRIFNGSEVELLNAADLWETTFNEHMRNRIISLAKSCVETDHYFHIGRGIFLPTAMENALKLKEVTYCHAEGMGAGFFKHGTLSLIDERFVTFAHLPNPELDAKLQSLTEANISEIEARGGRVVRVGHDASCDFQLPSVAPAIDPLFHLGFGQYFAYSLAKELGRDVDMPRSLAKSVTVR